ncbi:MAG: biotin synthase BioB [Proteobacteria bacterium]|nr:biotin synthase BioB [Pseudomonadota bacterium]
MACQYIIHNHKKEAKVSLQTVRHDWTFEQVSALYDEPFMELVWQAQNIHRANFPINTIQISTLQNIKVGGCPEDCSWCGQSVYHGVKSEPLLSLEKVIEGAKQAKQNGASRYCLAASWRSPTKRNLDSVIEMVKAIKALDLEACITVGQLNQEQAEKLKEAGLDFYNHNLETSENHFAKVSTTRSYDTRLNTLKNVRAAGINVCSGGILGMGETIEDRLNLLITLANLPEHPQSVPVNQLVRIAGTPLENEQNVDEFEFIRIIALARIMMPTSYVRLSGGRVQMPPLMQTLCFMAGANSIHFGGKKLLVTPNVTTDADQALFQQLKLNFVQTPQSACNHKTIPLTVLSA